MIFNIFLALVLIALLFYDFRKGVMIIALFSVTLNFFTFPPKALQTVYLASAFCAVLMGCYYYRLRIVRHPLFWCVLLPLVSLNATMFFHRKFSLGYNLTAIIQYVFPVVLYYAIKKKSDIEFYLKCMSGYLLVIVLYCFFEEIIRYNPVMAWCSQHSENFQWVTKRAGEASFRFGFKRSQSLFSGEAAFAVVCIYYLFILLYLRVNSLRKLTTMQMFLIFATPVCVLFTGTRSAILALGVAMISFVSFKSFNRNFIIICVGVFATLFALPYINQIIDSMLHSNEAAMGSSQDMRQTQWDIALYYMSKSLVLGNGVGFTGSQLIGNEEGLFGAEGMWLPIMMDRGILGVVSVLSAYVISIFVLIKKKMYAIVWVAVSFLAFKTITTVVGVGEGYYLLIIAFLMRLKDLEKRKIPKDLLRWIKKSQSLYLSIR